MLLGVIVAQGTIGFVQYFTDLPIVLVGFHMLGAALVSAAVTWVLVSVREPAGAAVGSRGGGEPSHRFGSTNGGRVTADPGRRREQR